MPNRWLQLLLLGACACLAACVPQTQGTRSIQQAPRVEASAEELAARNRSLLAVYSSELEQAADRILLAAADDSARRQALEWKAEAIPTLQATLLNRDPLAATMDAWGYLVQMQTYLRQPAVAHAFGGSEPVASAALQHMVEQMEQLVLRAAPTANLADLRRRVRGWADAHPLQGNWGGRESVDAEFIKLVGQGDVGALASLRALQEGLGDVTARLDAYNAYLPKQARWQAELLVGDLGRDPQFRSTAASLIKASQALDQVSATLAQVPQLAGQAGAEVNATVDAQRQAAQAFFREERLETQAFLAQQREAAQAGVQEERLAATADLRGGRQAVLAAVAQNLATALVAARAISQETVRDAATRARGLIDYVFWRALELVVVILLLGWLGTWWLLRRIRVQ